MGYGVAMSTRSYRHMSAEERETLSLGLAHGQSLRTMARVLGRAPSTVSREYARHTARGRPYRACTVLQRLFNRVDPAPEIERLSAHLAELVPSIPGVTNVVWE